MQASKGDYGRAAAALSDRRRHGAEALAAAVMAELPALKLERARFMVEVASDPEAATADGIDTVECHFQTHPGTRPGPHMKVTTWREERRRGRKHGGIKG